MITDFDESKSAIGTDEMNVEEHVVEWIAGDGMPKEWKLQAE